MFITYLYSLFVNALLKNVRSFVMIFGVMMGGLFFISLPSAIETQCVTRNIILLVVVYASVVFLFAKSFCRCSETVVFFKYFNYLVLAVEDPKTFHDYDYGTEAGRQAIAFAMLKDARQGLKTLVETIQPNEIHFTTHSKVLSLLTRQKALAAYTYEETKQTQKSLKVEACVLSSFSALAQFKLEDAISFNREIIAKRTFHTGKFVLSSN